MQVICISKGKFSGGKELAERLAEKLGYTCLSREELIEAAFQEGIQVGKLEMAMIKPRIFSERLAREKEHYRAFTTAYLCDKAMEGRIVYHGRTGHLLLPGVSHVMRVRVVSNSENRIRAAMKDMGIEREKARRYLEEVDEDWRLWVRSMYGISLEEAINYDMIVNLEQMSMENAASALTSISQLPDFQMTPASKKAMMDLRLGAHCRMALARDERTFEGAFKVQAASGVVTVSYLPQDSRYAERIPDVLSSVPDVTEVRTTMATTNILWIQEEFKPHTETFDEVVDIATKWNAAVELLRLAPRDAEPETREEPVSEAVEERAAPPDERYDGGIEDDSLEVSEDNGGLKNTLDELARIGRSGGGHVVYGSHHELVGSLDRNVNYTLLVIGDVFLSRGHAARMRATRDLRGFLTDNVKAPVVTADELGNQFLFGKRDIVRTALYLAATLLIYFLVFTHQEPIMEFLNYSGWYADAVKGTFLAASEWLPRLVMCVAVFLLVPIVAFSYGNVTGAVLKLIKME